MQKIFRFNRAFRLGLAEGFTSTIQFVAGPPRYSWRPSTTDARAWREIGALLNDSYLEIGAEVGKTTNETKERRLKHA